MKEIQGLSKAFGNVIAELRAKRGLSQEQLAEAIDSTNVYISLLENGLRKPSLNATILIAQSLEIQPDTLVERVVALIKQEEFGKVRKG
ncbi:MAG: helix-turn-helix transcriptional regulator [Candidatus Adiutrix sp.]|jgi:transcriptional regulator with XRE-family HTH domain|nr:helix-turn-helix transcriptional regulator [Candidatus Adiutrix sp.]